MSHFPGGWKTKFKSLAGLVSDESLLPGSKMAFFSLGGELPGSKMAVFSLNPHRVVEARGLSGASLEGHLSHSEGSTLMTSSPPNTIPPNAVPAKTIPLGKRFPHMNSRESQRFLL